MLRFFYFILAGMMFSVNACVDGPLAPFEPAAGYSALTPRVWYESAVREMAECVGRKPLAQYSDIIWRQVPGHTILFKDPVALNGYSNAMGITVGRIVYIAYDFQNTRAVVSHEAAHVMFAPRDVAHKDELWFRCIDYFSETWQEGLFTYHHQIRMVPFDSPDGRIH